MKRRTLLVFTVLTAVVFGCVHRKPAIISRLLLPAEIRLLESDNEFTEVFRRYQGSTQFENRQIGNTVFKIVHMAPNSGASTYPIIIYEKIDNDLWHLRATMWVYHSNYEQITVDSVQNGIVVCHDGEVLLAVYSSLEQEQRQRKSLYNGH